MRKICALTGARSDWGILLPILEKIRDASHLRLEIVATGMHLSPEFGMTISDIRSDGFDVAECVDMLVSSDSQLGAAKSMGLGTIGFAQAFGNISPDLLLIVGDRFEAHAAAVAALPLNIPVAHIHGGEVTKGTLDDSLRHSITKLSHLHFVSTEEYRERVLQLGEEPWRVKVTGAPSLDKINRDEVISREKLQSRLDIPLSSAPILATFHPVTAGNPNIKWQVDELLKAISKMHLPVIFTQSNSDPGGHIINDALRDYTLHHSDAWFLPNLGSKYYFSLMSLASVMVGNSSSGIIEAASFGLPVVNIGDRQGGRVKGSNVIDVDYSTECILSGIRAALTEQFVKGSQTMVNPYGNGKASGLIVKTLGEIGLGPQLVKKLFVDMDRP